MDNGSVYPPWYQGAIVYHIYPLGFCGAELSNCQREEIAISPHFQLENGAVDLRRLESFLSSEDPGLQSPQVHGSSPLLRICTSAFLNYLQTLGVSALYIGPIWHASQHGYDTIDFCLLDPRLGHGSLQILKTFVSDLHSRGIRVILDTVFNHVGTNFWAFRNVCQNGSASRYVKWFYTSLTPEQSCAERMGSFPGCKFSYATWQGYPELVKLNLQHPSLVNYLLSCVRYWIDILDIDGLRLDAADCVPTDFWRLLHQYCCSPLWETSAPAGELYTQEFFQSVGGKPCAPRRRDILLLGEITLANPAPWLLPVGGFHSVTNYGLYEALCSIFDTQSLERLGEYLLSVTSQSSSLWMYNFIDNHDVTRIASRLKNPGLELLRTSVLLFLLPGVPAIYYGSELGWEGKRGHGPNADVPLRRKMVADPSVLVSQRKTIRAHSGHCIRVDPDVPGSSVTHWSRVVFNTYCGITRLYRHPFLSAVLHRGHIEVIATTPSLLVFLRYLSLQEEEAEESENEQRPSCPYCCLERKCQLYAILICVQTTAAAVAQTQYRIDAALIAKVFKKQIFDQSGDSERCKKHEDETFALVNILVPSRNIRELRFYALTDPTVTVTFDTLESLRCFGMLPRTMTEALRAQLIEDIPTTMETTVLPDTPDDATTDLIHTLESSYLDVNLADLGNNINRLYDYRYERVGHNM